MNKNTKELYDFMRSIYDVNLREINTNSDNGIFANIITTAYDTILEYEKKWWNSQCPAVYLLNEILGEEYSISLLTFLKITVCDFICYMYLKYQHTNTAYKETYSRLEANEEKKATSNSTLEKDLYKLSPSERTDAAYPTLKHYYDNQKNNMKIYQTLYILKINSIHITLMLNYESMAFHHKYPSQSRLRQ